MIQRKMSMSLSNLQNQILLLNNTQTDKNLSYLLIKLKSSKIKTTIVQNILGNLSSKNKISSLYTQIRLDKPNSVNLMCAHLTGIQLDKSIRVKWESTKITQKARRILWPLPAPTEAIGGTNIEEEVNLLLRLKLMRKYTIIGNIFY